MTLLHKIVGVKPPKKKMVEKAQKIDTIIYAHERLDKNEKDVGELKALMLERFKSLDNKLDQYENRHLGASISKHVKHLEEVNDPETPEEKLMSKQIEEVIASEHEPIIKVEFENVVEPVNAMPEKKEVSELHIEKAKHDDVPNKEEPSEVETKKGILEPSQSSEDMQESIDRLGMVVQHNLGKVPFMDSQEAIEDYYFTTFFKIYGTQGGQTLYEPRMEFETLIDASLLDLSKTARDAIKANDLKTADMVIEQLSRLYDMATSLGLRANNERKRTIQLFKQEIEKHVNELSVLKAKNKNLEERINSLGLTTNDEDKKVYVFDCDKYVGAYFEGNDEYLQRWQDSCKKLDDDWNVDKRECKSYNQKIKKLPLHNANNSTYVNLIQALLVIKYIDRVNICLNNKNDETGQIITPPEELDLDDDDSDDT